VTVPLIELFYVTLNRIKMKRIIMVGSMVALGAAMLSFLGRQDDPWKVPEKYQKLKNPVKADKASIESGSQMYDAYCVTCHGKDGKGTGRRGQKLDVPPSDFTSDTFQVQTDGALLYKIYFGHRDMPGFKKKMPGNEEAKDGSFDKTRVPGDLINYLRTFAKKHNKG
jgi:cytochrome c